MARTRFTDPAAVDAWDRWFRWRNAEGLRDRTIDATWWRVAGAIAPADGDPARTHRYIEAFSRWQLLPDERLLRGAGTADGPGPMKSPSATLNMAAFVIAPAGRQAGFDVDGVIRVAALAVHLLDDAHATMPGSIPDLDDLHIGLIGLADAMAMLGIDYEDAAAAGMARMAGTALALGTLHGTVELAHERGAIDRHPVARVALWRERGMPEPLIADALRWGVRHARLCVIERQPRLALLANNASDALDPALPRQETDTAAGGTQTAVSAAYATAASMTAQLAVRAAIQPWIDAPIDYPLFTAVDAQMRTLAADHRLSSAQG